MKTGKTKISRSSENFEEGCKMSFTNAKLADFLRSQQQGKDLWKTYEKQTVSMLSAKSNLADTFDYCCYYMYVSCSLDTNL